MNLNLSLTYVFSIQDIYPYFWYPMKNILTTASQYMVVAVTVERYVVICHKTVTILKHQYYTLIVVIFSIIVNLPKFFEFQPIHPIANISEIITTDDTTVLKYDESTHKNESIFATFSYQISSLGENRNWYLFNAVHEIVVMGFCLVVICYCNYRVWLQVVKSVIHHKRIIFSETPI